MLLMWPRICRSSCCRACHVSSACIRVHAVAHVRASQVCVPRQRARDACCTNVRACTARTCSRVCAFHVDVRMCTCAPRTMCADVSARACRVRHARVHLQSTIVVAFAHAADVRSCARVHTTLAAVACATTTAAAALLLLLLLLALLLLLLLLPFYYCC